MRNRATLILTTEKHYIKMVIGRLYSKTSVSHTYYTVVSSDSWWGDCLPERIKRVYVSCSKQYEYRFTNLSGTEFNNLINKKLELNIFY